MAALALLACGAADKKKEETPACLRCGATCDLVPTCVCEPGTKKQPKVEFETTCEPICIPACGGWPWPFGGHGDRVGCVSCCREPCDCASRVRYRKKLQQETVDEEVPVVTRKVAYLCGCCAGKQREAWWSRSFRGLTWWWPRAAGD
jgi:hypothetical protein